MTTGFSGAPEQHRPLAALHETRIARSTSFSPSPLLSWTKSVNGLPISCWKACPRDRKTAVDGTDLAIKRNGEQNVVERGRSGRDNPVETGDNFEELIELFIAGGLGHAPVRGPVA